MISENVFTSFPLLRTRRCLLKQLGGSDIDKVHHLLSDKNVVRYIEAFGFPLSLDETQEYMDLFDAAYCNRMALFWVIKLVPVPETLIGLIGIHQIEIGNCAKLLYLLSPQYWRNGYMLECLMSVTVFCFEKLGLRCIKLSINVQNVASIKLAEKCGYTVVGRERNEVIFEISAKTI